MKKHREVVLDKSFHIHQNVDGIYICIFSLSAGKGKAMKAKKKLSMIIDLVMTIGLLLCMSYLMIGEALHEWIGMTMLLLFIAHHF